jgi:tetratricopeptide (TPR) repeat protein
MKIHFVAIVKNEEKILERCLNSVKDCADEYHIFDTGSTDTTRDIAGTFGFVYNIPFENYAAAKNLALERVEALADPGDWILLSDADEYFEADGAARLKQHAENPDIACVSTRIVERIDGQIANTYFRNRMWRVGRGWRFQGPGVHEVVSGEGASLVDDNILVNHDHSHRTAEDIPALTKRFERYLEILYKAIQDNPKDTRSWFYAARTMKDLNRGLAAIDAYEQYLSFPDNPFIDERWQAAYDVAVLWKQLGEYDKALQSLDRAMHIDPRRAETFVLCGEIHYRRQDWLAAIPFFEEAIRKPFPRDVILFIDPRMYRNIPLDYLSVCYYNSKQFDKAANVSKLMLEGSEL